MTAAAEFRDIDLDEPAQAKEKRCQLHSQVLKKVVIPVNSRSSIASSLSSVRDQSSEYDTPGTSVVATPAESLMKEERSFRHQGSISTNPSSYQPEEPYKGKRKRSQVDELVQADALLAQKLQEQEYGVDQEAAARSRRARHGLVADSEESLLSDSSRERSPDLDDFPEFDIPITGKPTGRRCHALPSQDTLVDVNGDRSQGESFHENEVSETPMLRSKRVKTDHRTTLPSRAARDSANKSIKDRTSRNVLDSEDSELSDHSDDVSFFDSDIDSDVFEDSEDADEVVAIANSLTTAVVANESSSRVAAIPGTGRRGTGRRAFPSAQATNSTRGRHSWQRRIEDRVSSGSLIPPAGLKYTLGFQRAAEVGESAS